MNKGTTDAVDEAEYEEFCMNIEHKRLATFVNWPFKNNCNCTPENVSIILTLCKTDSKRQWFLMVEQSFQHHSEAYLLTVFFINTFNVLFEHF